MVAQKKTKEKPAKNPFSTEPKHYYVGSFDGLPIAPEEAPEKKEKGFIPSKESIKFEAKDLSYLKEISKGKLLDSTTDHAHKLFGSLRYSGWTEHPRGPGDGDPLDMKIEFSFVDGVSFLTGFYKKKLSLMEKKEDELPKRDVYNYLNYLERHTSSLLKEMEEEQRVIYHYESVDLSKPPPDHRSYVRTDKKESILERFLLKPYSSHVGRTVLSKDLTAKFDGSFYSDDPLEDTKKDKQLISRLSKDLKSFLKYIKATKEEIDKGSLKKGRPPDPCAVPIMAAVIKLFDDFKMDNKAWELSDDARWTYEGLRLEEWQSDLFKVISIIFKTAGRTRRHINNVWKAYQDNPVPPPRYPNETPDAKEDVE